MFGRNIAMRTNAIRAKIAAGNFGGPNPLCRREGTSFGNGNTGKDLDPDIVSENKENKAEYEDSNAPPRHGKADFVSREPLVPLREKIIITADCNGLVRNMSNGKRNVVLEMLAIEAHHVEDVVKDVARNVKDVVWCPSYVRPELKRTARGGDEISHHKCKCCQLVCFHLLNDGEKYRPCLRCAGWSEREIPPWYYHESCEHCK